MRSGVATPGMTRGVDEVAKGAPTTDRRHAPTSNAEQHVAYQGRTARHRCCFRPRMLSFDERSWLGVRSVDGRNLFGDLDVAVGHLPADVIAGELEGHFAVCDMHIGVVIHRLKIRHETVDEA